MNHDRFALRRLSRRVNLQSLVFSLLRGVFESTVQRLTEPHLPVHFFLHGICLSSTRKLV